MDQSQSKRPCLRRESGRVAALRSDATRGVKYRMRLFVAADEPNSRSARRNLEALCAAHLAGNYELTVIDVFADFAAALAANILVTPALVIDAPQKAVVLGNLQDTDKVLAALELA